jgi:thymidylate synthase (FAD)
MIIKLEPNVKVVAQTNFTDHPTYHIPDGGDEFTRLGAFAAKGCYDSFGKSGRANDQNQMAILEHRHGSVLEHMNITLFVEGITRGLSLELNRHRSFAISQRSTRYTAEEDSAIVLEPYFANLFKQNPPKFKHNLGFFTFITEQGRKVPDSERAEHDILVDHLNIQYSAIVAYEKQVERLMEINPNQLDGFDLRKWARGKARNVLPHGIETRGTWTNNIRGWRWFIESRSDRHAEPEIRSLAHVVLKELREVAPLYFKDFKSDEYVDTIPEWTTDYSKV